MISLVGCTGFVGSNICDAAGCQIDKGYNSKNIREAYGTKPELLIYAGVRAEKYLANKEPDADMSQILQAEKNIAETAPKKLVLISTIDVFKKPYKTDEDSVIDCEGLHAYGLNRYRLEQWVRERYPDALIIRLPGLYGINIKKNFIYDYINVIPYMLKEDKFCELASKDAALQSYYEQQPNGFYRCIPLEDNDKTLLKEKFKALGFTALNFTDSRNIYQFYPLSRLWSDIKTALEADIRLLHTATEPIAAGELYEYLTGRRFVNEIPAPTVHYDYRTKHAKIFDGDSGYLMNKTLVLEDIKKFVENN